MNLMQMSFVITQAYLFLTSMEAVRGQTPYSDRTLGTVGWTEHRVKKCAVGVWCLASNSLHEGQKCSPINEISLHISNSRTKPAGLDFQLCNMRSLIVCFGLEDPLSFFDKSCEFSDLLHIKFYDVFWNILDLCISRARPNKETRNLKKVVNCLT